MTVTVSIRCSFRLTPEAKEKEFLFMKSHVMTYTYSFDDYRKNVFGGEEAMIANVRAALKTDPNFLTDEIILAPLHSDVARKLSEDYEQAMYGTSNVNKESFRGYAFLNLLGSICHALNSRAKDPRYSAYAATDWLAKSQDYYSKATLLDIGWRNINGKASINA